MDAVISSPDGVPLATSGGGSEKMEESWRPTQEWKETFTSASPAAYPASSLQILK